MRNSFRALLFRIPFLGSKIQPWYAAAEQTYRLGLGDYYSPIASDEAIQQHARFDLDNRATITPAEAQFPAIDVNLQRQLETLHILGSSGTVNTTWMSRYQRGNNFFQHMDAIILHAMISRFRPQRIIEIGSGFSTLAILDSLVANGLVETSLTLIEPNPERLLACASDDDQERFQLLRRPLQIDDLELVKQLTAGDLLLVDSSHVYKIGSDVQLLFESFYPQLQRGVLLHIHDVFFPFDYPASWLRRGHHFNEAYVLRSFLQYNRSFEILFWNDLIKHLADTPLPDELSLGDQDISTSIWLRRTA